MPEQHGRYGAAGPPAVDDGEEGVAMGVWGEVQEGFEGVDGSEVAEGEDICALKDENEVDVDGPVADPFEGGERGANFFVWKVSKTL